MHHMHMDDTHAQVRAKPKKVDVQVEQGGELASTIEVPDWTRLDLTGPDWTRLDLTGPDWTRLDLIRFDLT